MYFCATEPVTEKDASLLNVLQLAYIGDAVWELIVRERLIRRRLNVHHMHSECIKLVNARAQASFIQRLSPALKPSEAELVRRGRNAHIHHPVPKNQNPEDYAMATGFEVLIGFLHLTGNEIRIYDLTDMIFGGENDG